MSYHIVTKVKKHFINYYISILMEKKNIQKQKNVIIVQKKKSFMARFCKAVCLYDDD